MKELTRFITEHGVQILTGIGWVLTYLFKGKFKTKYQTFLINLFSTIPTLVSTAEQLQNISGSKKMEYVLAELNKVIVASGYSGKIKEDDLKSQIESVVTTTKLVNAPIGKIKETIEQGGLKF